MKKFVESGDAEIDATVQESIEWLTANEVPWDLVLYHWEITSKKRCDDLKQSEDKNLTNIFNSWKLYDHVHGYELIDIDFKRLKLTNVTLTIEIWNTFFNTLKININEKDETAVSLNKEIPDVSVGKKANL